MLVGRIIVIAITVLFGWGGWWIGKKVGIDERLGIIMGLGIWVALVFLIPGIGVSVGFFLTGCCQ
jgi:hypothetical protein